jgi:hypothetical protein
MINEEGKCTCGGKYEERGELPIENPCLGKSYRLIALWQCNRCGSVYLGYYHNIPKLLKVDKKE